MKVALISCCGLKLQEPAPAEQLYQSQLFKKNLAYAKQTADQVFILSAELGLVRLDQVIEPYDFTLTKQSKQFKLIWSEFVAEQLELEVPAGAELTILAGRSYRDHLIPLLDSYTVQVPLAGKGIGEQLSWLTKKVKE